MVMSTSVAVMGDVVVRERLPAIWRHIEDAHYSYLETDDSPEKLQQKKKLEGYIMEYLSLVPHEFKFGLSETNKVFQRTINELPEFSAYRAGLGWTALARYAANLLTQPWRKEYKTIRLYSGYFKHEVEANMVGAETLLQAMGYKSVGGGRLVLDAPVCPDMVAAISRDALIAQCECQIMSHIWESIWSSGSRVTWGEVARMRSGRGSLAPSTTADVVYMDGTGGYPQVPKIGLSDAYTNSRLDGRYQNNVVSQCNHICTGDVSIEKPISHVIHPSYIMPSNMVTPHMMYTVPQHLHSNVPITVPQCSQVQIMPTCGELPYYCHVQSPYMISTPVCPTIKHASNISLNGHPSVPQYRFPTVPTAQLIELDTPYENGRIDRDDERSHRRKHTEVSRHNSTSKSGFSDVSLPSISRSDTQPSLSKAREDGMGTYESWDYVFRNLSSKDQEGASRNRFSPSFDRDSRTLDRFDRDERRAKYQPTTLDLEDGMQALNLDRSRDEDSYRTAKVNENLMRLKQEQELKRAKQLAKKHEEEKRVKRVEPVGNPTSDALINTKVAPDKVRLLTKKDIKERRDVIKQQNGTVSNSYEAKRDRHSKPIEIEKSRVKVTENGVSKVHSSKNTLASGSGQSNHDLKTQLMVTLDETDATRRSQKPQQNEERHNRVHHDVQRETQDVVNSVPKKDKWHCTTCTYLNKASMVVCEMCGKSKRGPEIQPLMSGGRECPACTLVNKRDAKICEACDTSLQHCPTYI